MTIACPAYFEIIEFFAAGATSEDVVRFHPSPEAQQRVLEFIEREKEGGLLSDDRAELEHILRMAKAKARQILARG